MAEMQFKATDMCLLLSRAQVRVDYRSSLKLECASVSSRLSENCNPDLWQDPGSRWYRQPLWPKRHVIYRFLSGHRLKHVKHLTAWLGVSCPKRSCYRSTRLAVLSSVRALSAVQTIETFLWLQCPTDQKKNRNCTLQQYFINISSPIVSSQGLC